MNAVTRPLMSGSRTTRSSGKASSRRLGGVTTPTGTVTMTAAVGVKDVPGTRPRTVYEPGCATSLLSTGEGQITRTSGPALPSRYVAGTVAGSRGSVPTTVATVMSETCDSTAASGDSLGMPAVEISGGGVPRPRVVRSPGRPFVRIVA